MKSLITLLFCLFLVGCSSDVSVKPPEYTNHRVAVGSIVEFHPFKGELHQGLAESDVLLKVTIEPSNLKHIQTIGGIVSCKAVSPGWTTVEISMVTPTGNLIRHLPAVYRINVVEAN